MNDLQISDIIEKFQLKLSSVLNELQNIDPKDENKIETLFKKVEYINNVIKTLNQRIYIYNMYHQELISLSLYNIYHQELLSLSLCYVLLYNSI